MRYRHRAPRCAHGFYAGLCLEPACPHWDGVADVVRQKAESLKSRRLDRSRIRRDRLRVRH